MDSTERGTRHPGRNRVLDRSARESMEQLFRAHYLDLVRLSRLWVRDLQSAEDVVQDVFATFDLRRARSPVKLLQSAVANRSRSLIRRRALEQRKFPLPDPQVVSGAGTDVSTFDQTLARAIKALPDRQRDVLILRFYLDWSVAETAAHLGISEEAVRGSTHRATCQLRGKTGSQL